jgi:hypothetical protein
VGGIGEAGTGQVNLPSRPSLLGPPFPALPSRPNRRQPRPLADQDMHELSYRHILAGLLAGGVLAGGSVEELLEADIGALFMPHGEAGRAMPPRSWRRRKG